MRRLWIKRSVLFVFLSIFALQSVAIAAPKAKSAKLETSSIVIDLAKGKTAQLSASVLPSDASQKVQWKSSNTKIATVSQSGVVTAKKTGKVYIYVRPYNVNKLQRCTVTIKDSSKPSSITVSPLSITMSIGESKTVSATVNPSTANQGVSWQSKSSSIASVSQTGTIVAKKAGKTQIRVRSKVNTSVYKIINVTVQKQAAPTRIDITPATREMNVRDTLTLSASPVPSTASASVSWSSSNTSIATVSSGGVVTAKKAGTVKITATSKVKSSVKTIRTLTISDPKSVTGVSINQNDIYLGVGDAATLTVTLRPSGARSNLTWKSSNTDIVSVDSAGKIRAKRSGTATITVKTETGGHTDSLTVTVLDTARTTNVPERTTGTAQINANLAKIDAIRISANNEIASLLARKVISTNEANKRKAAIVNAFAMYRFPWMTESGQNYWSSTAPSKAYQPGVVYYGMPYTQTNRTYELTRAVSGGYFSKTGKGYYLMSSSKKLNKSYVGSDCSSFVSMSIWGTGHTASFLNTVQLKSSSYYKTITGSNNMRPGDILVKSGVHTVMFLYYIDNAKTQMMIIEQGGGTEPNTIACRVKNVATYTSGGYIIRRPIIFV